MKKFFAGLAVVLIIAAGTIFAFRAPIMEKVAELATADMFVARDADAYDPGVAVGQSLPAIRALFEGREITSLAGLMGERGMVLFVNRSADW